MSKKKKKWTNENFLYSMIFYTLIKTIAGHNLIYTSLDTIAFRSFYFIFVIINTFIKYLFGYLLKSQIKYDRVTNNNVVLSYYKISIIICH